MVARRSESLAPCPCRIRDPGHTQRGQARRLRHLDMALPMSVVQTRSARQFLASARIGVACSVLLLAGLEVSAQTPSREYQVKAVFLFNFAQFVEWPPTAFR